MHKCNFYLPQYAKFERECGKVKAKPPAAPPEVVYVTFMEVNIKLGPDWRHVQLCELQRVNTDGKLA